MSVSDEEARAMRAFHDRFQAFVEAAPNRFRNVDHGALPTQATLFDAYLRGLALDRTHAAQVAEFEDRRARSDAKEERDAAWMRETTSAWRFAARQRPRVRIMDGWHGAGRLGFQLGPELDLGTQRWTPVAWDDAEDPDWHKTAGLVEVDGKEGE